MKPNITVTRDSASIEHPKFTAYYGPSHVDQDTNEWKFVVYKNGKEVFSRTNSELLEISFGEGPKDLLIAGIALYNLK
jgi:hypothetical protein